MKHDKKHLRRFYYWISERHEIWRRRFIEMKPPPWTKDKWLCDYKFTNAYRQLDRGTIWYMANVALPICAEAEEDKWTIVEFLREYLWQSCCYRLLNRIETFEQVALPWYHHYDEDELEIDLRELKALGVSVFTNAYHKGPCPKGVDTITGYIMLLSELHDELPSMVEDILQISRRHPMTPDGAKRIHAVIQKPRRLGHFTAYEVYCDLCYVGAIPFTTDTWANAGPGAQKGLKLIFGEEFRDWGAGMTWLRDNSMAKMEEFGLPWHGWRPIDLRLIEHSLCEYGKYDRLSNGTGKARMVFKPGQTTFTKEKGHAKYVEALYKLSGRLNMFKLLKGDHHV